MSQAIGTLGTVEMWQEHPSSSTPSTAPEASSASAASVGEMTSVCFAEVARQVNRAAASLGLTTPAFRSPPRRRGVQRTIARRPDGSATVSVALRGRPAVAVAADMIDGVIAANQGGSGRSDAVRDRLWAAAVPALFPAASANRPMAVGRSRSPVSRTGRLATPSAERPAA